MVWITRESDIEAFRFWRYEQNAGHLPLVAAFGRLHFIWIPVNRIASGLDAVHRQVASVEAWRAG
jgi:hypothetical protein